MIGGRQLNEQRIPPLVSPRLHNRVEQPMRTYIQPHTARLQTDNQHLRPPRRRLKLRNGRAPLLHVHRPIEPVELEMLALERCADEVQEGSELAEDDGAEAGVLIL